MNRETFDGEQAPAREAYSYFRRAQERDLKQRSMDGSRAKEAFVDLCNQADKFPRARAMMTSAANKGPATSRVQKTKEEEEDEDEEDEEFKAHLARLRSQPAQGRTLSIPRTTVGRGGVEMRRFVKLFSDKQAIVNKGTEMDKCRWTETSTGLDLNLRQWGTVKLILSQSMQRDEGRAERDSLRIVLQDVFKGWTSSELTPRMVLNDGFVFQPLTIHAVGPINEWRFLPGKEDHGAFLLTRKRQGGEGEGAGAGGQPHHHHHPWLGIGIGYVAPVNSVNTEFVPFRAAVGLNVFELHPDEGDERGRYRTSLKLQAVFTPAQLGSVQVDWGHITQYTPVPSRAISFRMPVDRSGERFVYGSVFSRDGEPFSWSKEQLQYEDGHTIQSKMHAMLSRMPMVELAAKILMFKIPTDVRAGLFRMYTRTGRGGGRGDEWPVFTSMQSVGPFLQQQVKLMYHTHLLKLSVYVLTMDCMRLSGVFGRPEEGAGEAEGEGHRQLLEMAMQVLLINDRRNEVAEEEGGGPTTTNLRRNWGRMLQSVMHMWHMALGTFPFGNSNQKFCTSEDYYKTVFGLETVLDALVKLHYILSNEHHGHHHYARPRATITQISDALREEVDRRVCGDEEKLKFLRASVIGEMRVGKPRFSEGNKSIRKDPLSSLDLHDLVCTDSTGDIRSARLQLPVSLKSMTVRFDLGRTMGRFLPYWSGIQARYLPSNQCFNITKEDLRAFPPSTAGTKKGASAYSKKEDWGWTTNDCCATGRCSDPLHVLNHALYRHAHTGLRELMARHHEAQSPERMLEEHKKHMLFISGGRGGEGEEEGDDDLAELGKTLSHERASFLKDSTSMREFNQAFLSSRSSRPVEKDAAVASAHKHNNNNEEGLVVELPLSVSGKVIKCVVNASFAPPTAFAPQQLAAASSMPSPAYPALPPPPDSRNTTNAIGNIMHILKTMAASQGVLPPRAAR